MNHERRQDQSDGEDADIRAALARTFASQIAEAPRPPARLVEIARGEPAPPRHRVAWIATAAAVLVCAGAFFLSSRPQADASPLAVLSRAASSFLEVEDARLLITIESEAIHLLEQLLADEAPAEPSFQPRMLVFLKRPNRFMVWVAQNEDEPLGEGPPLAGFDGTRGWSYDAERNVVEVATAGDPHELERIDLTRFLSFEFVREIERDLTRYEIVELPRPKGDEAGLRTFRLKRREEADPIAPWMWNKAVLTVDPRTDRVVRAEVGVRLGPLSLAEAKLEVIATNEGADDDEFRFEEHVPQDASVVAVEAASAEDGGISIRIGGDPPEDRETDETDEAGVRIAVETIEMEPGRVVALRTGMTFAERESILRRSIISTRTPWGLKVRAVEAGSPAERAGVEAGDLLMKWNGSPVKSTRQLAEQLAGLADGESIAIELSRRSGDAFPSRSPWKSIEARLRLGAP